MEGTRDRIIAAARALFDEHWWEDVTLNGIAVAAGVSHQTVLNHFGTKDGVLAAMVERAHVEEAEHRDDRGGDTDAAIAALLARYEGAGLAGVRAVYQEHRVPALKAALDTARAWHRDWIERTFAHALPASGPERRQKIAAFVAATEVLAWKSLRHDYGFSERDTAAAITTLIHALEEQE